MTTRDLEDRVFLVTGANTGLGKATVHALAARGGRVVAACRNRDKGRAAIESVKRATGSDAIDLLELDLGSLAAVRTAAQEFLARGLPLHCLINNAGVGGQRGLTQDGFEIQFGTNHLGHHLFTRLLEQKLVDSAPSRIVMVSSGLHAKAKGLDLDLVRQSTPSFTGLPEYNVSKLANVLFGKELGRRLAAKGVTTCAANPGPVATEISRRAGIFGKVTGLFLLSPEEGARTQVHCATADGIPTGTYWDKCKEKTPSALALDDALARKLWDKSEEWVAPFL